MALTLTTDQEKTELLGRASIGVAVLTTVLAPIHALSRYATADGKSDLDSSAVRAWAEPARDALEPLLDWASADTVYTSYGKVFFFVIAFMTVCALVVRGRRPESTGAEKWGWRIAAPGYVILTVGCLGEYWSPWLDETFAIVGIPGILLSMIGSFVLGIGLLRRGFQPRATAVLLIASLPLLFVLSDLIALGATFVPLVWAWSLAIRASE